jgi:hypothetical protein
MIKKYLPVQRLTPAGGHYFFGYFDKCPWNSRGEKLLSHNVDFVARQPLYGEKARLGVVENGKFEKFAETLAWNWQQGSMLQYFSDHEVIFNDVEDMQHVARILDLNTGAVRTLCRPIYCLSPDRKYALSTNFCRLERERPGYGYPGVADPGIEFGAPEDDGIWLIDIEKNEAKLLFSYLDVVTRFPKPGMAATNNWFNHLLFSPDGRNFAFIHRWRVYFPEHKTWRFYVTRMFSSDLEGNLNELPMNGHASHFTWKSERELIIFSEYPAGVRQYNIYTIPENKVEVIAENLLPNDGHCSFSPDGSWLLTDSYIREDATRCIALYHPATGNAYEVGSFFSDASWLPYARCDLHPRWSPDMTAICFDSMHEGFRGTYALDTTSLVK